MLRNILIAICQIKFFLAAGVLCFPLSDSGPHVAYSWDNPVRLRHLYAVKLGLHLQINGNGKVDGSAFQSPNSLMEIRPVDTGCVAIKGVTSSKYLCMEERGRLYGLHAYNKEDCTFEEHILPDGYSIYISGKHGAGVSLSRVQKRLRAQAPYLPPLSLFLPMVSAQVPLPESASLGGLHPSATTRQEGQRTLDMENMDPFGIVSQALIQSPSFDQR